MMYSQDSAETFGSVWSQVDGINDVGVDNKSITELLSGGNFRAKIQDSWGTPVEVHHYGNLPLQYIEIFFQKHKLKFSSENV